MSLRVEEDISFESESEEDPIEDGDTTDDISTVFRRQYTQVHQECASLKKKYITSSAASSDCQKIAIGLGNELQIYDVTPTGLSKYVGKNNFGIFEHNVCSERFFNDDPNIVLVATFSGEIHMFDLRTFTKVHTFEGTVTMI